MRHRERECRRDAGIDRIAAVLQDRQADVRRRRADRHDDAMLGGDVVIVGATKRRCQHEAKATGDRFMQWRHIPGAGLVGDGAED